MRENCLSGLSIRFRVLSRSYGQVAYVLLTRSPLGHRRSIRRLPCDNPARLACIRHAASVRPEPGSNSPVMDSPKAMSTELSRRVPKGNPESESLRLIEEPYGSNIHSLSVRRGASPQLQGPFIALDVQFSKGNCARLESRTTLAAIETA